MGSIRICDFAKTPLGADDKIVSLQVGDQTFEISEDSAQILINHLKGLQPISLTLQIPEVEPVPKAQSVPVSRPAHLTATVADAERILAESQVAPPFSTPALSSPKARREAQAKLNLLNEQAYMKYKNSQGVRGLGVNIDYKGENK